jgi:hypothetical protein
MLHLCPDGCFANTNASGIKKHNIVVVSFFACILSPLINLKNVCHYVQFMLNKTSTGRVLSETPETGFI